MTEVGYYKLVPEFSLAGNEKYGDCVFATQSNYTDLITAVAGNPELVLEAEAERWYTVETGWTPLDGQTDKGEILEKMLQHWRDHGNPSDPLDRITEYYSVSDDDFISPAIDEYGAVFCTVLLPRGAGDTDDLSGDGGEGIDGHAMLIVDATDDGFVVITWGEARTVSRTWWERYGQESWIVHHPAWRRPA